ncbi:MAG: hypothetical protein PGN09_03795 [Sphingomonas fennica]
MSLPPETEAERRRRQNSRALVTALILGALVALFYAITIAKMA